MAQDVINFKYHYYIESSDTIHSYYHCTEIYLNNLMLSFNTCNVLIYLLVVPKHLIGVL